MQLVIDALRDVLGQPQLYVDGTLDMGLTLEYCFGGLLVLVVVASVFKLIVNATKR